ncbi:pantoate--beta-alanine ligase [Nocardia pseudobrasiliensis]|uniref:Pantothenate synthetase n=1 Tax=Nocardia pseudobrasiliensis TaxID=45979 RepID=A0A370I5X5_9NOCA|nr:pantoate--beta-alanine ligase [Nocardia pseudobrasiliensis]RDI65531.1 pantothenate synthetase [Nocardia pseudobrasiliensis]
MIVVRSMAELREMLSAPRDRGESIGYVPTMGALHEGHLALVRAAKTRDDVVVASVFVNPLQFAPHEDFESYPRDEDRDLGLCEKAEVDIAWLPSAQELFPPGFGLTVAVPRLSSVLCGRSRPTHFAGVTTEMAKILIQLAPTAVYLGEKDFQQLVVMRALVRDLGLPLEVRGVPTVREPDGLALSSRNAYLTIAERPSAAALFRILSELVAALRAEPDSVAAILDEGRRELVRAGVARIDYLELVDSETLEPVRIAIRSNRLVAAVWVGNTRLIDNLEI